jgi:hypothetical protein
VWRSPDYDYDETAIAFREIEKEKSHGWWYFDLEHCRQNYARLFALFVERNAALLQSMDVGVVIRFDCIFSLLFLFMLVF